jgi:predicted transcriptional regulator YheO
VRQGRTSNPEHAAGAGADNTDPHHSGTEDEGKAARCGCSTTVSPRKVEQLQTLAANERTTVGEICQTLGISRATFYRYLE